MRIVYLLYLYNIHTCIISRFSNQTISALYGVNFVFSKGSIRVNIVRTVCGVESLNDPVAVG